MVCVYLLASQNVHIHPLVSLSPMNLLTHTNLSQASTNYKEAFALFDKRGNGRVALESLGDLLRACGQNPTLAEIRDLEKGVGGDCTFLVYSYNCEDIELSEANQILRMIPQLTSSLSKKCSTVLVDSATRASQRSIVGGFRSSIRI